MAMMREVLADHGCAPPAMVNNTGARRRDRTVRTVVSSVCFALCGQLVYANAATSPASFSADSAKLHNNLAPERDYSKTFASSRAASLEPLGPLRLSIDSAPRALTSLDQLALGIKRAISPSKEVRTLKRFESFAQLDGEQRSEPISRANREGATDDAIDDPATLTEIAAKTATTASSQLDIALGHRGVYSDLLSLQDRIINSQRPVANAVSRYSTQSDNLNIFWEEISQDIYFADGADRLRPGVQYIDYSPRSAPGVRQYSIGADGTYRFNDVASLSGDFWLNDIHPKNLKSDLIPTYDLFVTLLPNDYFRVDVDSKREIFDNVRSLQLGINAYSVGGSVDYSPTDRLRFTLRGAGSFYSDTNERQFGEAEAIWRVLTGPTIEIGVRGSAFRFSKQLNSGYFNPKRYVSAEGVFRVQTELSEKLTAELAGAAGIENTDPGGSKPLVKTSLQLIYNLTDRWSLDGGVSYFSSQDSSSSGFARTAYTAGLHYKFD